MTGGMTDRLSSHLARVEGNLFDFYMDTPCDMTDIFGLSMASLPMSTPTPILLITALTGMTQPSLLSNAEWMNDLQSLLQTQTKHI